MKRSDLAPPRTFACVLGDLDLIRPLAMAGIPCAVVASPRSAPALSRLSRTVVPWDGGDISEVPGDLPEHLLQYSRTTNSIPVLFYQEDEQLLFVSRHRTQLAGGFRFVIPAPELVEDLVDKARFHVLAERLGLPVPPTQHIRPASGFAPGDFNLRFPLIIKPLRRRRSWAASGYSAKALQIDTREDLQAWWPRWAAQDLDLLAQEQIPGPESRIESYHVYTGAEGDVVAEFTGRKIRTLPPALGHSTALVTTDAEDVAALGRSLVRTLGLCGVAKFDFKRAPDGKLYLLEVNPRFNLWHHLGAVAGVNLPALVYGDLTGLPRPAVMPKARPNVTWCRLSDDLRAARASGVSVLSWLTWAMRCEAKSLAWNDPLPLLQTGRRLLANRLNRRHRAATQRVGHTPAAGV